MELDQLTRVYDKKNLEDTTSVFREALERKVYINTESIPLLNTRRYISVYYIDIKNAQGGFSTEVIRSGTVKLKKEVKDWNRGA
jgi:hypothetical protein